MNFPASPGITFRPLRRLIVQVLTQSPASLLIMTKYTFADFVAKFPPVPMPVTLGEDTHHVFARENEPLPDSMVVQFIHPADQTAADDEFTEYVPCFAIDNTESFIALVWWKATLLNYEYVLATFTNTGQLISRRVIAFTKVNAANKVQRAVASIDEDWVIYIAEGESDERDAFDPTTSRTYDMEIMANGMIE